MNEIIMFVHDCFMAEVKNDLGIKMMHWNMLYGLLKKSVVRLIRYQIHWSRGT